MKPILEVSLTNDFEAVDENRTQKTSCFFVVIDEPQRCNTALFSALQARRGGHPMTRAFASPSHSSAIKGMRFFVAFIPS